MLAEIDWHAVFFLLLSTVACVSALAVLFSSNIVRMAFHLVVSLSAVSGLFFLAGAEFVGAMQLMVYVGGTLVLLVFGVMLTAQSRFIRLQASGGDWVLALLAGGAMLMVLLRTAFMVPDWSAPRPAVESGMLPESTTAIGLALTGVRLDDGSGYLLPFVIVSIHLLTVLIGAAYLARAKRRSGGGF